jgi:hypothetical protein
MTKKKPRYESRVFDGRIIHSAEIERIHREVLDFERIARAKIGRTQTPPLLCR